MTHSHVPLSPREAVRGREKTMQSKLATCYIVLRIPYWTGKEQL
jgi:hypothetical protein